MLPRGHVPPRAGPSRELVYGILVVFLAVFSTANNIAADGGDATGGLELLDETEVEEFGNVVLVEANVLGLDVAEDDAMLVQVLDCRGDAVQDGQSFGERRSEG